MSPKAPGELKLGFHINTPAHSEPLDWGETFEQYLRLVEFAEELGFDSVWSRQRHFQPGYLSAPLNFFAAASQRARRIGFGTALLVLRYQDPILLGEELSTLDLISGGRLEVVYSNSRNFRAEFQDGIFRITPEQVADRIDNNLSRLRSALRGEPVHIITEPGVFAPDGPELLLQPRSPRLVNHLWYGSGSVPSAVEAGEQGLNLFVSTVGPGDVEATQVDQIRAYKSGLTGATGGRIGVGRYVLPVTKPGQAERYERFHRWFTGEFSRMGSAPIYYGEPDQVVEGLLASDVVKQSETLLVYLPYGFTFDEYRDQLEALATTVAPQLGWKPLTQDDGPGSDLGASDASPADQEPVNA
jgi:alkanesulfonate monooxygenase SsuD/methylene tetrahydromethanopterin reductase-like flavin-dependent oxidoreductase (luciferase family)